MQRSRSARSITRIDTRAYPGATGRGADAGADSASSFCLMGLVIAILVLPVLFMLIAVYIVIRVAFVLLSIAFVPLRIAKGR